MIVNKALEFLQREIAEDKKEITEEQLLQQAKLYRELGEKTKIDRSLRNGLFYTYIAYNQQFLWRLGESNP